MSMLLSLNSVCLGDHTLKGNSKNIVATDPGLCFGHMKKIVVIYQFWTQPLIVPKSTKPKAIIKLCFSEGIVVNKWGNETTGYKPLGVDSAGPHGIDFQCRGLLESSDSSLDHVILSIVSTFCVYHLSYKNNFMVYFSFVAHSELQNPLPFGFP